MSWLPYRWRTQRNAIRHANCKTSESSKLWTHLALPLGSMSVGVSVHPHHTKIPLFRKELVVRSVVCISFNGDMNELRWTIQIETNPSYPLTFRSSPELFDQEGRDVESVYSDCESRPPTFLRKDLNRECCKIRFSWLHSIHFGPPIRQEYPLNLSI